MAANGGNGNGPFRDMSERDKRLVMIAQELFLRRAAALELPKSDERISDLLANEASNSLVGASAFLSCVELWVGEEDDGGKRSK